MFRQCTAILLLLAFAVQVFNCSILVLDFYANRAAFAQSCENKMRPMLHCNGKCQLMKKLREEEKKDQQNPERRTESNDHLVYVATPPVVLRFDENKDRPSFSVYRPRYLPNGSCADIFHPPALV